MSKELPETSNTSEEVDLGQLFKLIGNAFERFFKFIGSILNAFMQAFVWLVFFVKKNIVILLAAGLIGFGIGFLEDMMSDPIYVSKATVNQNYSTGENLTRSIEYFNSLINQGNIDLLKRDLEVTDKQALDLLGFHMESIVTENQKLQTYNSYIKTLDSAVAAGVDYEQYIENFNDYSYSTQQLSISSRSPEDNFRLFDKIIERTSNSSFFKRKQENDLIELENTRLAILNGLEESKELQATYRKVLEAATEDREIPKTQTSITIEGSEETNKTREFELYKNNLILRREIVSIDRMKEDKKEVIEIVSLSQSLASTDIEIMGKMISKKLLYGAALAFLTFILILGIRFLRYLENNYNVEV